MRPTPEAACLLWLGCSNNSANSHSSLGALNCRVLCTWFDYAVLIPASSTTPINDALRLVTGCLRPTPADNLPTLTGIQLAELCRNGATLSLARHATEPGHLLHSVLTRPSSANAWYLKPRHPFVPATQHLISLSNNIRAAHWADQQWKVEWTDSPTRLHFHPRHWHPLTWNDPPKKSLGPA